jgi:hypothetical protein
LGGTHAETEARARLHVPRSRAGPIPAWGALPLLAGAVALHTYGELWQASASFALDFGLAPAHAQGQYQGLIGVGNGAGQAAAPVVLIGLFLSLLVAMCSHPVMRC